MLPFLSILLTATLAVATVSVSELNNTWSISNDRVSLVLSKKNGAVTGVSFDNTSLLGTNSGNQGKWYFDAQANPAIPPATSRYFEVGTSNATFDTFSGTDSTGSDWVGIVLKDYIQRTGLAFNRFFFIKDGETGVHQLTRLALPVAFDGINYGSLGEMRTVFRPNADNGAKWSHLVTNALQYGHLPSAEATKNQVTVQDATWYLAGTPNEKYVDESSDYFTKYEWADSYGDHKAHGFYSESRSLGLWTVYNNLEGYIGGPLRSDLVVDTNVYDYFVSNHRGASTPELVSGFDRLFGPSYVHMNQGGDLQTLYADAAQHASSDFDIEFYDSISEHVPGLVPSSGRGTFSAKIEMPQGAGPAKAVLTQSGVDMQDNINLVDGTHQYWMNISSDGHVEIPRVIADEYRLTVYAEGIFGDYTQDSIRVSAGETTSLEFTWTPEQHGEEIFTIGTPDKSAGEFRHGYSRDPSRTNHEEEYRSYWGAWDFPTDYPTGVNFTVGMSDEAVDLNYVHWSRYGGSYTRPDYVVENINVWTVNFELSDQQAVGLGHKTATLTIQLAGARTASGNLDVPEPSSIYSNVDHSIQFNSAEPLVWTIPYTSSSSCAERSGISCYNLAKTVQFNAGALNAGWNTMLLSLPYNASGGDANFAGYSVNVMYDAIRLELQ